MADPEAARIDKANHLLLDQPLLRLPYELLRKNFRSAHFVVEKESAAVKNALKESATAGLKGQGTQSADDVVKSLDAMISRMRGVKRKLQGYADEEAKIYRQVDARTAHLAELASLHSLDDDVGYGAWSRRRLDRLLVDYLLRHSYTASASAFVSGKDGSTTTSTHTSAQLHDLVDMDTFAHMTRIRQRLVRDHSVAEALAWCVDNKKELRKMESRLEFMLRFQQYIELVRTQDLDRLADAIAHARRYLTPLHATYPDECRQAAMLLCFASGSGSGSGSSTKSGSEYAALWDEQRWTMLADLFTETHSQLLGLPSVPLLHLALSSGLSALKTPACHATKAYASATTEGNGNSNNAGVGAGAGGDAVDVAKKDATAATTTPATPGPSRLDTAVCPICSLELNELARHVPYAHHSKSHVESDLVLLPNGRVYSMAQLEEQARKANLDAGWIKDLRTGSMYAVERLKKVYIS